MVSSDEVKKEQLAQEIKKYSDKKAEYQTLAHQLQESEATQIYTSDPDSRQMITRNNITENDKLL